MSSILTSRIVAMALMMALLVKPCLGLISDWTAGRADVSGTSAGTVAVAGKTPDPCKRICLNGRVEEAQGMARQVKVMLAGDPVVASGRGALTQIPPASVVPMVPAISDDVRTRLAVLSRLLL
jgi:hypothetical protein